MDRFKELGIDTHGRTSGKMKTKCPWCHAQRTDKRDKSLSVNLDTKLYLCHYCGAHGSAAIYAGKGRKLGDPLVKFPTATGSNSSCPPSEKPHGDPEQGALTQKQIEWCRDVRHIPPEVLVEAGVAFASISMPISGKEKGWEKRDCLCFNFFENGELVNTKFRDSQKHFKLLQGARTIPYNIDAIRDTPECILVEGEFDALSYMAVSTDGCHFRAERCQQSTGLAGRIVGISFRAETSDLSVGGHRPQGTGTVPGTLPTAGGRPLPYRHLRRSIQGRQRTARGGKPGRTTEGTGGRTHPPPGRYVYGRRLTGGVAPTV
ncbi:hypothetical protein NXX23_31690 [Bacteroides ovatus]|nr:hypothetical protein [Bacteroides ovatus]